MILSIFAPAALLAMQSTAEEAPDSASEPQEQAQAQAGESASKQARNRDNVPEGTFEIDGEEIRCRYERYLDSKIPRKVCHTMAEWEARQKMQEDEMRSGRNRNSGCEPSGPC